MSSDSSAVSSGTSAPPCPHQPAQASGLATGTGRASVPPWTTDATGCARGGGAPPCTTSPP
eukprot:7270276-Alexandrium_andersonii.AAC.1